ncbi:MAG: nickel pincer cofactor biosynthesis protein LarC [Acidimicrobiia bacterium]|nr:nickel pincer cofactor biosynthesis protein LarC [Acidimicrobiia bacterium]
MAERTVAWFHCFAGIAGDMALGALVDAGADLAEVEKLCRTLPVEGWSLEAEPVLRGGVAATKVHVHLPAADPGGHGRTWAAIREMLTEAPLPPRVRARATAVFETLATAEGALHRTDPDAVHFHEVGAIDAIVDVVGTCAALEVLGIDEVRASTMTVGEGTVRAAHGVLPNPSPAVVRILAAAGAPVRGLASPVEHTTPTGAALMAALATGFGPMPPLALRATGFGAGGADPDGHVNATQVVIGTAVDPAWGTPGSGQPVVVVETNVDDITGEALADAVAALLDAGAHDAWITATVMKKGRPAHTVSALADPSRADAVARALRAATGSMGVRASTVERWPAARDIRSVDVDGHEVRVKRSADRVKAEHDDVLAAARASGRTAQDIAREAEAAVSRRGDPRSPGDRR